MSIEMIQSHQHTDSALRRRSKVLVQRTFLCDRRYSRNFSPLALLDAYCLQTGGFSSTKYLAYLDASMLIAL